MTKLILSEKARKARNEYMKQYRDKNKEKVALYNHNYWERKVKEMEQKEGDE